ncbi:Uma2 family endonuclease [Flavobacterium sp. IMCC34518]|uniref:Uma2 family endonuclease n=1 Tax=Flavobacterium sp. IMCC34518 TaxID=3003623 RepID=UPI0022ABE2D0|nr:Uma2 family endonuclease [Flavobacterium sp. IMCC34518]
MATIITDINDLDLSKSYTYADYLTWNFQERLEILKGRIFKMSPAPSRKHQEISIELTGIFYNYFKKTPCNVYVAPFDVRLKNFKKSTSDKEITTVFQPDICVICDKEKLDDRGCIGAPDLIIEILSPGNSKKEMDIKFDLYEENGVKEYWIVEPYQKSILIYTLQNDKYIGLKPIAEEGLVNSPLFPELSFNVEEIFRD